MNATEQKKKAPVGPAAALLAAAIAAAAAIIAPWEGEELKPYRDLVGKWTVCYGDTTVPMREYTPAECRSLLETQVGRYMEGIGRCIRAPVTTNQLAAITSWTYNVGVDAACKSTLIRKLNAGATADEWCRELLRWNRAGGREVRGLTNRRKAEYEVCVQ